MTASAPSRRRRFRLVVVVLSVAAAIGGSAVLAAHRTGERATTRGVTAVLPVSGHPGSVAAGRDALWIPLADTRAPVLVHLDLASDNTIGLPVDLGGEIRYLAHLGRELFAAVQPDGGSGAGAGEVVALNWRNGQTLGRRELGGPIGALVRIGNDLWALRLRPAALVRLDARTLAQTAPALRLAPGRAAGLADGDGYLWVTLPDAGEVVRVDPSDRSTRHVRPGGSPTGVAVAAGRVWVTDASRGELRRVDPRTLRPIGEPLRLGGSPSSVAATRRYLFVGDAARGTVMKIDVRSGKAVGSPVRVAPPSRGAPALAITPAGASVWVSSFAAKTLTRVSASATTPLPAVPVADRNPSVAPNLLPIAAAGRVVATIHVPRSGGHMGPLAVGEGAVWALSNPTSTLLRIDPTRNKVVARIPMSEGDDAAAGDGAVWITHPGENTVSRVDPRTNAVSTIRVPDRPSGIAVTPGAVWVAEPDGPAVSRIDPSTNRVVATKLVAPDLLFAEHMSLGASGDAVWVAVPFGKRLVRVDRRTNRVTTTVGLDFFPCGQVAVVGRFVWAAGADCTNVVERVDPRANGKATELTEPHAVGVVRGFGSVWVAALRTGNVERIDPRSARVVARIHVGGYPVLLGVGFGSVWVIDDKGRVIRVEPAS